MARKSRGPVCIQGNFADSNLKGLLYFMHCSGCGRFEKENSDQ